MTRSPEDVGRAALPAALVEVVERLKVGSGLLHALGGIEQQAWEDHLQGVEGRATAFAISALQYGELSAADYDALATHISERVAARQALLTDTFGGKQTFTLDPHDSTCFAAFNLPREALKRLEGRQVAMLNQQELELLSFFMDQGRKQGVSIDFDTDTDQQGWAEMNSVRALEILAIANSYIRHIKFT